METENQEQTVPQEDVVSESATPTPVTPKEVNAPKNKTVLVVSVVAIILALGAGTMYFMGKDEISTMSSFSTAEGVTTDPQTVRAVINGEELKQEMLDTRLQEASQTLISQGVDITNPEVRTQIESQILQDTISYILLKQAAIEAGTVADADLVESTYQGYVTQLGDEDALLVQLKTINITPEEFKQRIEEQLMLDAYISDNVVFSEVNVSEKDAQDFYDTAVASVAGGNTPAFEDVRAQIEDQLTNQQKQTIIQSFTDTLRESATIEIK